MNILIGAVLLLVNLGGPGDSKKEAWLNLLAEPLDDFERRIGETADDNRARDAEDKQESPDEPRQDHLDEPRQNLTRAEPALVDFEWLELVPRFGIAIFSKNFYVSPTPAFGFAGRAPMTWLSPSSNPDGEYFGIFGKLDVAIIKRTIFPVLNKPSGPIFMVAVGMDYTIYRSENWLLMVEGGIQYAHYGGITDLRDGYAPMAGLKIGLSVSRTVSLMLNPEFIMGQGDSIIFGWLAAAVEF